MGETKVRVFVVRIRVPGETTPKVYRESLSGDGARALAKSLAISGIRASVVRFDVAARDLEVRLIAGKRKLELPVSRLRQLA